MMGRFEEALALIRLALELDPLSMVLNTHLGWIFYFARQFDKAAVQLRKALEMDPGFAVGHYFLGLVYLQKGMIPEAIVEFQTAIQLVVFHQAPISGLGLAHGLAGRKVEARSCLEQLLQQSKKGYVAPYYIACVWIGLGDKAQAFHCLEKAFEEHSSWMVPLKVDPSLDSLRSDPRFKNLIQRVGLPP
jgi:tetratricopeptide (TPR) repeat protein